MCFNVIPSPVRMECWLGFSVHQCVFLPHYFVPSDALPFQLVRLPPFPRRQWLLQWQHPAREWITNFFRKPRIDVLNTTRDWGSSSTSRFCPALMAFKIFPSCISWTVLRNDLEKNDDIDCKGQSGGTSGMTWIKDQFEFSQNISNYERTSTTSKLMAWAFSNREVLPTFDELNSLN